MSSQHTDPEVPDSEIREWFKTRVAIEVEEAKDAEITAEHVQGWQKGILAWYAEHFVNDDPASLMFPDGTSDGGMDIVSVITSDQHNHVRIFQCSSPTPENLADGFLSTKKTKFAQDVREFRNNVVGKARRLKALNSTAQEVFRQLQTMRELAASPDGPVTLTIEIHPLALRLAHPDARRELEELQQQAETEWSTAHEQWIVHDVQDVKDLYKRWRRRRGKDDSPSELRLHLVGEIAKDHPDRGPFLCFIKANDLIGAYDEWGAGLLDSNLRYALGKSEVNKTIEAELERPSGVKWFHEKNNGVVLICDNCQVVKDYIRLSSPQIVNGGQTVHSILNVVRELEGTPLENRTPEFKHVLSALRNDLRLSVRIVTISGGNVHKPDQIAIASNTQNKLSERTMKSSSLEMRDLRLKLAAIDRPWYLITKDGEWSSVSKKKSLFQSKTGNRQLSEFKSGNRYRRVENTELAVAMMAFLGFVEDARVSRVFKQQVFGPLFGNRPMDGVWSRLMASQMEWNGAEFRDGFEAGVAPAAAWLLAHMLWSFWKTKTLPESQQLLLACEESGARDPRFKAAHWKSSGWDVTDEARTKLLESDDSCYWREQIAKSAYLVLTYQSMRILGRCFGALDERTCTRILGLRQFADLLEGQSIDAIPDFRAGSLSDGPLTSLGRVLMYACELLWQRQSSRIRVMPSRQQTLLTEEWVRRLSDQVDLVVERLPIKSFRVPLEGPEDRDLVVGHLRDLLT